MAVLGNGIDDIYPQSSRGTALGILERGGLIFSEYPPGTPPLKHHFPARNRIVAGLCRGVVVIQAPEHSGALITAEHALEQGRDLFVHRAGLCGSPGAGTRRLAESGAMLIEAGADVMREWGLRPKGRDARARADAGAARGEETGKKIARMVADELSGSCSRKSGQTPWRVQ